MRKVECFKIRLAITASPFNIKGFKTLKIIHSPKWLFLINPTIIEADPFLFVHKDILYLFFESKKYNEPGVINMIYTKDLKTWSKPITVLKEKFHLSYPFVFEDDGVIYMIPETCADNSIRIYKANNSLTSFIFEKQIIKKAPQNDIIISYSDNSIFKKGNIYYLMTTINYNGVNNLELYTSNSLLGEYTKHPLSPIIKSNKFGRNGGAIFEYNKELYRPSQDCTKRYGDDVQISKIDKLSTKEYQETLLLDNLLASKHDFYKEGGHHCNIVYFNNLLIQATDAKEYKLFPLAVATNKIRKIFREFFPKRTSKMNAVN